MDISDFGKGAVQTPVETRNRQFRLAATPSLIDWTQPYKVPANIPVLNQGSSSSCTAHATVAYCMALEQIEHQENEEFSRRFIYSQTSLGPGQGTYIWKAMSIPLKVGLTLEANVPDGLDEQTELDKTLNATAKLEARADKYAVIPRSNIDQMAQIVKDYGGFVTGFNGFDGMFSPDGTIVDWSKSDWGHAVYVYGYEVRNGIKYLRFRNSWSSSWGSGGDGFFPESFVDSGLMFDCYTYANVADLDPLSMPLVLARDSKDPSSGKVYALFETNKTKCWVPNPPTLNAGIGAIWQGFDSIVTKDLSGYKEGVIQISLSE